MKILSLISVLVIFNLFGVNGLAVLVGLLILNQILFRLKNGYWQ